MASRCDITDLTGRSGSEGLGQRPWVQVSRVKEPSCARSQGRTLRGPLVPQDIQVVTAFSPGRSRQGCGNEPPKPQFPSQLSWLKRAWVPKGYKIRWAEGGSVHTS